MIFRRSFSDPFRRDMAGACFDPGTIALATAGVSAATGIAGQMQQTQIQADQANYMAQVARNNQQVAQLNAQRALQQGQVQEDLQRQKTAQRISTQRAGLASQGGDVNSGSSLDIIGDTARTGEFNAQTIRNDAATSAWHRLLDANSDAGEASLYDTRAANTWLTYGDSLLGKQANWSTRIGRLLPLV